MKSELTLSGDSPAWCVWRLRSRQIAEAIVADAAPAPQERKTTQIGFTDANGYVVRVELPLEESFGYEDEPEKA